MGARVERLVNLTIALLETRRPLSLAELQARTGYWGQEDPESARRMFERDKEVLRSSGIPIQTRHDPLNNEVGYIIDRRQYELPDVDLTREETAALAVALRMTGGAGEQLALSKLAARAPDPDRPDGRPPARVAVDAAAIDEVAEAVVQRQSVRFPYRTADGVEAMRTLDPWGVVLRRGNWYLVGRDHDRDAIRAFRFDRMVGPIEVTSGPEAFEPVDGNLAAHVAGPASDVVTVELAVSDAARWAVQARGGALGDALDDGRTLARLTDVDRWRILPWILGFGPQVEVLAPTDLRDQVRERLKGVQL